MSAALKRRFNFVTIPVVADLEQEARDRRAAQPASCWRPRRPQVDVPPDLVRLLTTVFAELRRGQTLDGTAKVKSPSTVLSTAELISVVADGALMGSFFGAGRPTVRDCFAALVGTVAKENRDDLAVLEEYLETVVKPRDASGLWRGALRQAGDAGSADCGQRGSSADLSRSATTRRRPRSRSSA